MRIALVSIVLALLLAPMAGAHVTVNPDEAAAGSFARFDVRAPNERDNADTTEVTVQLPEGLFFVSFQPKPGWERTVEMEELSEPVEVFGSPVTERVASVTWSGGTIAPGEFDEFGFSALVPEEEGQELVFPSLQTYSNGEVVRWIGPPDADEPAPIVTVTAAETEEGGGSSGSGDEAASDEQTAAPQPVAESDEDNGMATLALVLGIAGLVAGLAALAVTFLRPRRA